MLGVQQLAGIKIIQVDGMTGGAGVVIDHAAQAGKFEFFPPPDPWMWLTFLGALFTMMLGSLPQQDVFQRVTSAKSALSSMLATEVHPPPARIL